MRALTAWLLSAALILPGPATWAASPDQGVSPAGAAATSKDGETMGDQAAQEADNTDLEARLTAVEGPVYVHLADQPEEQYTAASVDMPVSAGDEIRTGEKGSAELTLEGHTLIQLQPHTDFVVNSLAPEATEFHLGLGSLIAKVKHLVEGRRMEFHTPTAVAAVRGTELGVSQDEAGPARVGVFDEGNVAVRGQGKEGEVHIGPNQEAQVARGQAIAKPGGLSFFQAHRERMALARGRVAQLRQTWKPLPLAQRQRLRGQMLKRPALQRGGLQGLSPSQRQNRYAAQRQRQQALRGALEKQRRQRMQQRQQQRQRMQERRKSQQQQRQQQKQQRAGQGGQGGPQGGGKKQRPNRPKKKKAEAPQQKSRAFQARGRRR